MFLKTVGYHPEKNASLFLKWAKSGLLIYLSSFFWAPSRDGLQIVFLFAFFIPMTYVLLSQKPKYLEYGGWMTYSALAYAGFATLSSLWGVQTDLFYFAFQWIVLAIWLCGVCFLVIKFNFDLMKCLFWFVVLGSLTSLLSIFHYYYFVFGVATFDTRLWGWNIFRNPNELGAMCGIVTLIAYIFALQSSNLFRVWMYYSIAAIPFTGLILSSSRGSLLSFVVTAFLALILIRPSLKIWMPPILVGFTLIVCLIDVKDLNSYYIDGRSAGFSGRLEIWNVAFESIKENFIFGVGLSKKSDILVSGFEVYNHAHSAWIDTIYRTGIVGFFLFIMHLATIFTRFSRNSKLIPFYLWLCYGCIYSILDGRSFFWDMGAKWFLYWIPIGLIIAFQSRESLNQPKAL